MPCNGEAFVQQAFVVERDYISGLHAHYLTWHSNLFAESGAAAIAVWTWDVLLSFGGQLLIISAFTYWQIHIMAMAMALVTPI